MDNPEKGVVRQVENQLAAMKLAAFSFCGCKHWSQASH